MGEWEIKMRIVMNNGGIAATNSYLVADEEAKEAVIFDAPDHTVAPLLDECEKQGWSVVGLWLTHGHFDHIADHEVVTQKFPGAKVLIHGEDARKLKNPNATFFQLPFSIPARSPDETIADGQKLKVGKSEFEVIYTPGHSPGHVAYYCAEHGVLVGGDLIIMGAVGRTDFPDCSYPDLMASIRRVMKLPMTTRLLPGHGEPSTLAYELETNPYVQEAVEGE